MTDRHPEDCPTPIFHETHRYCPLCSWTEVPIPPDSSLREQLRYELTDVADCGLLTISEAFDAAMTVFSAGLAAARADEREKIEAAIEAERLNWSSGPGEFNQGRDVGFIMAESVIARSAGVEPKEQQT